ncbi:MAG: YbaK/EbsC family protein [Deltaproteobacteria bacterium]
MAIPGKLAKHLNERKIPYRTSCHPEAFTAMQSAQAAHVPPSMFAKSVLVNADGKLCMVVLPATERVDMPRLRKFLEARKTRLAAEAEFAPLFQDCDIGAMPIFGSLYGIPVLLCEELAGQPEIAFTAGTHRDIVRMRVGDYIRAESPRIYDQRPALAGAS